MAEIIMITDDQLDAAMRDAGRNLSGDKAAMETFLMIMAYGASESIPSDELTEAMARIRLKLLEAIALKGDL